MPPEPTRPLVLVAEDDDDLRELVAMVLEHDGHRVVAVGEGTEALAACSAHSPDLLVLDLSLPGMTGVEICRALRADPVLADVPVLLVTGMARSSGVDEGLAAGADDFMMKPFRPAELIDRVSRLLSRPHDQALR